MAHEIIRDSFHKNLSVADVKDIRNRYVYEKETQKSIGDDYGISIKLVYNIVHGKVYKDIEMSEEYKLALLDR